MTEPNAALQALIDRAVTHLKAQETDQTRECVDQLLAADPEHLDGHILAGHLAQWPSQELIDHYAFVLDRDIQHREPRGLGGDPDEFAHRLLSSLGSQLYLRGAPESSEAIHAKVIHYSTQLLVASRSIGSIYDFVESLLAVDRWDDVINLGRYTTKEVTAAELGWPGLDRMYKRNTTREILHQVMAAYELAGRFEDGCLWIFGCVTRDPNDYWLWRWLGLALCWVGYPEETARAWIVALRKGDFASEMHEYFDTLTKRVHDPGSALADKLFQRMIAIKDQLPPEKLDAFQDLTRALTQAKHGDRERRPTPAFIEAKLGIKLPPAKRYREDSVVLSRTKSKAAFIPEIIALLDHEAMSTLADPGAAATSNAAGVTAAEPEREKVAVGADADSNPSQQGVALYQFGIDITEQARQGAMLPIVGRDREIERMIRILVRQEKNNPILLGEAGVGKTAAVHGLAQRIAAGTVPAVLKNRRIIELNVGVLVAGTRYRGEFEQRITNIVKETRDDPNIILFIDELHTLIGAGSGGHSDLDASNIMKPALANGELRLIGATTAQEFTRTIEKDAALERRFSPIWLREINAEMTRAVLQARRTHWEKHHGVRIDEELLRVAVQLAEQHVRHRHFPDKAIDLIDEACALVRVNAAGSRHAPAPPLAESAAGEPIAADVAESEPPMPALTREHLQQVIDEWSGAASKAAADAERPTTVSLLDECAAQLREHVVGHEQNLLRLAAVVVDERLALRTSRLPRVLLFGGRANTGKAACARALASVLWPGQNDRFLFINMARYADPAHITQLIGVPPGYAGGQESGLLSLQLRQRPHSVIMLYNFPQAHEHVLRLFANLFREGSLPDARGQIVYGGNAIFVLSTTLGDAAQSIGFVSATANDDDHAHELLDFLNAAHVPEEILDAAQDVFWFDNLNAADTRTLIERQLQKIAERPGLRELGIPFSDDVVQELVRRYRQTPPSARNLKTLLNQVAYPFVRQRMSRS